MKNIFKLYIISVLPFMINLRMQHMFFLGSPFAPLDDPAATHCLTIEEKALHCSIVTCLSSKVFVVYRR